MAALTKNTMFKPGMPARDKAENTTSIARSIAQAEVAAREAKTARLRQLRLAKEAADEEARAAIAAAQPKPAKARTRKVG
jgi:hypothetical protein